MFRANFLFLTAAILIGGANSAFSQEEPENFELSITGQLVEKLEPGTKILVGTIGASKKSPSVSMSTSVEGLPLYLPKKHFQNHYLRVWFYSPSSKEAIFSMEVSSDLFDKVRSIKLKLDQPKPSLRTTVWWDTVQYKPSITNRMAYMNLPYWDNEIGKLVPAPQKPMLHVDNGNDKTAVIEMRAICMGNKWYGRLPRDLAPKTNTKITYTVDYDSGGAFEKMSTKFQYDYRIGIDTD